MKAYHFLKQDMTAGSGSEPAWKVGETRTYSGKVRLCHTGYHSSRTWYDALRYAPEGMACIVDVSKPIEWDDDKQASATRTLVACRDASGILRLYTADCAAHVLHIFEKLQPNDTRPRDTIEVARRYANGDATDQELRVARDAAWDAAKEPTDDPVFNAAFEAAESAAWAASEAEVAVVRAAAEAAAGAAGDAEDAEIKWQRRRLNRYMKNLFKEVLHEKRMEDW